MRPESILQRLALLSALCISCSSSSSLLSPESHLTLGVVSCIDGKVKMINASEITAGLLETPNFPAKFPLPLDCTWIIDNSNGPASRSISIYFTQFYLSPGFLSLSSHNDAESANLWISKGNLTDSSTQSSSDFQRFDYVNATGKYIVIRVSLDAKQSFNHLHQRALDVMDPFGFRIAFEVTSKTKHRSDYCSLKKCNLNGECVASLTKDAKSIRSFDCICSKPNRPKKIEYPFHGPQCQGHSVTQECDIRQSRRGCSGNGICSYFTSRHVQCHCDKGYEGKYCQTKVTASTAQTACNSNKYEFLVFRNIPKRAVREVSGFLIQTLSSSVEFQDLKVYQLEKLEKSASRFESLFFHSSSNEAGLLHLFDLLSNFTRAPGRFLTSLASTNVGYIELRRALCPKGVVITPTEDQPLTLGHEFHLSCSIERPSSKARIRFEWTKDQVYSIDSDSSVRDIHFDSSVHGNDIIGFLVVKGAHAVDRGTFSCRAIDEELEHLVPLGMDHSTAETPFQSSVTQSVVVNVATEIELEVYPRTLTLLPSHQPFSSSRALQCLASKAEVEQQRPLGHLRFRWVREPPPGRAGGTRVYIRDTDGSLEFEEKVILPLDKEDMLVYGSILRLGDLKQDQNYTCEVYDTIRKTTTSVTSQIFVSFNENDVCHEPEDSVYWPVTKAGSVALRECINEQQGLMRRTCHKYSPIPIWDKDEDKEDCVHNHLLDIQTQVDLHTHGYVHREAKNSSIFLDLTKRIRARPLYSREWEIIHSLTLRLLHFLKAKQMVHPDDLPQRFFSTFIGWLRQRGIGQDKPEAEQRLLQLVEVVQAGAEYFSSQLEANVTQRIESVDQGSSTCHSFGSMSVAIGRLGPRLTNWSDNGLRAEKECFHASNPLVTMSFKSSHQLLRLGVIRMKGNEKRMTELNQLSRRLESDLVTVFAEEEHDRLPALTSNQVVLNVSLSFLDKVFHHNDSAWRQFSCGRLDLTAQLPSWNYNDSHCALDLTPIGLTCICSQPGTYALVWNSIMSVGWVLCFAILASNRDPPRGDDVAKLDSPKAYVISLASGAAAAICSLAVVILLKQWCKSTRSWLVLAQFCTVLTLLLFMVLLLVTVSYPKTCLDWWTSPTLQSLLILAQGLQIFLVLLVIIRTSVISNPKKKKAFSFGALFLLPFVYFAMITMLEGPEERKQVVTHHLQSLEPQVSWFIQVSSQDLALYLSINLMLLMAFLSLVGLAKRILVVATKRNKFTDISERESLLQRAGLVTFSLFLLNTTAIIYCNMSHSSKLQYLLGFAIILAALVTFLCYLISSEGYLNDLSHVGKLNFPKVRSPKNPLRHGFHSKHNHRTNLGWHAPPSSPYSSERGSLLSKMACSDCSGGSRLSKGRSSSNFKDWFSSVDQYEVDSPSLGSSCVDSLETGKSKTGLDQCDEAGFDFSGKGLNYQRKGSSYFDNLYQKTPMRAWGKKTSAPRKLAPVKCRLNLDPEPSSDLTCEVQVHKGLDASSLRDSIVSDQSFQVQSSPPHLDEIVHQAQQEVAEEEDVDTCRMSVGSVSIRTRESQSPETTDPDTRWRPRRDTSCSSNTGSKMGSRRGSSNSEDLCLEDGSLYVPMSVMTHRLSMDEPYEHEDCKSFRTPSHHHSRLGLLTNASYPRFDFWNSRDHENNVTTTI